VAAKIGLKLRQKRPKQKNKGAFTALDK